MRPTFTLIAILAPGLMGAASARAEVITETFTFDRMQGENPEQATSEPNRFDPALGTLDSWTIDGAATATFTNAGPGGNIVKYTLQMPTGIYSNSGTCVGDRCTTTVEISAKNDVSNLDLLVGTFPFGPIISASLVQTDADLSSRFGTFTLTYDYTPAALTPVPEATTWTAMLLGFVGLGFGGYSRSRKRAALAA
jgi:hypothetical protein